MQRAVSSGWMLEAKSGLSEGAAASCSGIATQAKIRVAAPCPAHRVTMRIPHKPPTSYLNIRRARCAYRHHEPDEPLRVALLLVGNVDHDFARLGPAEAFPCTLFDAELPRSKGVYFPLQFGVLLLEVLDLAL